MFFYHLRLARQSLAKQPLLTTLMVTAIAVGVGVFMTVTAFIYAMSGDPIPHKSDQLYNVRIDSWSEDEPYNDDQPDEPPWQLTHRDAMALLDSDIPVRQAAMRKAVFTAVPEKADVAPFLTVSRITANDFFAMFDVPFLYGGPWDDRSDERAENVVVLSRETNEKLFGGEDSVGREVRFGDDRFLVTGVMDTWEPGVLFYDVNNGPLNEVEDVFMPFSISDVREVNNGGNTNCWKDEPTDTYQDMLNSECIYVQFWAELPDAATRDRYQAWLDSYTNEQRELGRLLRPNNNRLDNVVDYLRIREVVRDEDMVMWSIAMLFLVACLVNTVGLILARFIAKAPVIGLRRALGASRFAIFRQHLVEVGLIGFAGGVIGIGLSYLGLLGVHKLVPDLARVAHLDPALIAMTVAVAIVAALVAGLYPTWRVCRLQPAIYLKTQ